MSNTGGNGDGAGSNVPKMGVGEVIKLAREYIVLTDGAEMASMEVLALFTSVIANYFMETYGLDIQRVRFQRAAILAMSMMRAAYGLGASKGLPSKGGVL